MDSRPVSAFFIVCARLLAMLCMAAIFGPASAAASETLVTLQINADRSVGPLPDVLRIGTWPFVPVPPRYVQDRLFADFKPGTVQIDLGEKVLGPATDEDDVMVRLGIIDPFLRRLATHGDAIFISFSKMPPFLAASQSAGAALAGDATTIAQASPPRDYAAWGALLGRIVSHIRGLGIHPFYNIGWEPDTGLWQGTAEQFFALYRTAALAVRQADSEAKIGGPAVSDFGPPSLGTPSDPPMIKQFLAYASKTPLPELGLDKLPIDFISFHLFGADPQTSYAWRAQTLRSWLSEYGYDPDTPIFVGEWSDRPGPTSKLREHPFIASYVVANLIKMARAGIGYAAYTSLTEQQTSKTTNFDGGFGLFTRDFIQRPSYRAFQALDMLGTTQVEISGGGDQVYAVAAKDDAHLAVVATNFIPQPEALLRAFVERLSERGYSAGTLAKYFKNTAGIETYLRRQKPARDFGIPEAMTRDVDEIAAAIRERAERLGRAAEQPITLRFDFEGLSWLGPFTVEVYKIDGDNQNAVKLKSEIDARLGAVRSGESARLRSDFATILTDAGYSPSDVELAQDFAGARDRAGFLASRPAVQRARVIEMVRLLEGREEAAVAAAADKFNHDPRIAFAPVSTRAVPAANDFTLDVSAQPASVTAVVLKRQ